ncbi:camphor resistance protein CrcB [Halobacillus karajensis]|uniref:Fluoride-specific ion channel FluC n=1 Tax=Halobacillus karajensis TaxID=195088 RepID=A0A024P6E7_9BACI|nr:fluoride efflux transporter CrcB [Halobacillus karajensis]CDQ17785.1 camphor resistance protein CrcB [Halobacillus karajensis]CDQ24191.1 camphor resistance protein CrcB [Halobacillus karajensis]CDQ29560.1 camphor resistance protein CrcB [Halobacillus karajensis]SEH63908.1 camphor resistance protein CrcB [Halobacillus karajensis]
MLIKLLLIGSGGFIGAVTRYTVSQWINKRTATPFPFATLFVNILGSFLLGLLSGLNLTNGWILFCGTGILGSFTTFSTFKLESVQLHFKQQWKTFILYTVISYGAGILLAFCGCLIGNWLIG